MLETLNWSRPTMAGPSSASNLFMFFYWVMSFLPEHTWLTVTRTWGCRVMTDTIFSLSLSPVFRHENLSVRESRESFVTGEKALHAKLPRESGRSAENRRASLSRAVISFIRKALKGKHDEMDGTDTSGMAECDRQSDRLFIYGDQYHDQPWTVVWKDREAFTG